jgi:two-component system, chemotaxis family, chemotaxis protein CheY
MICPVAGEVLESTVGATNPWEAAHHAVAPTITEAKKRMSSVLVVDDEDQIRQLIRETLTQAGYQVTEARDGKDALQQYRLSPTDLVIMDILMPDQDGLESITTLKHEFPNVKIIAITGGSDMIGILNFLDVAKMLGAHRTLQKPFDMKTLIEAAETELQA